MNKNVALTAALVTVAVVALVVTLSATGRSDQQSAGAEPSAANNPNLLVRPDSHLLSRAADGKVTLVEFLDFECEACRSVYPYVEQLRRDYQGRVSFVLRYFPVPSHANGENAAIAVEAAARQGALEPMYRKMYETQPEWGEQQDSAAAVFRGFAQQLGLDLAAYDQTVADPATLARVRSDRDDGMTLGVKGTPTFFLNGQRLQLQTTDDLRSAIDNALAGAR